ncbi:MAG: CapA family protein [Rhodanobacteraceae bacterium]
MHDRLLKLAFVGDVCLSFFRRAPCDISGFTGWPAIRDEIGEHDFLVGNLECCLVNEHCSDEARRQPMAVPATAGRFLHNVGFSDLCLANNHSLDCGSDALTVTRECLASHGMRGFGAGLNLREAEEPVFAERNGCRVAFLGACDRSEYYASNGRAGIAPLQKTRLGERVRAAVTKADLVVVMLHADLEFSDVPGRWRQRLSRWLIEQGAHLVIQHHPHVLQGSETYQGGVIAYSLGNFVFKLHGNRYQQHRAGVSDSLVMIVDADLRGEKPVLAHRVVPLRIGPNHLPEPATGLPREEALLRVQVLSSLVADRNTHRSLWFRRCRLEAVRRIQHIYYAFRRGHIVRGTREFLQLLTCREDHRWMLGLASLGYL